MTTLRTLMTMLLALGLLIACGDEDDPMVAPMDDDDSPAGTIPEVAADAGSFTMLLGAVQSAGLAETLSGAGPFTVFAPTDAAFEAFEQKNPGVLASLTTADLADILKYHVVSGRVLSTGLSNGEVPTLLDGKSITVNLDNGVMINDAMVITPDVAASNGVIHVIDSILLPPADDTMGPVDDMMDDMMGPTTDDMTDDMKDDMMDDPQPVDIVDTAVAAGFSRLAEAVTAAGLVDTLKGDGPFTVFAPTDDAFEAFEQANPGVLEGLSVEELTAILTYHVLAGEVMAGDLVDNLAAATVNGAPVLVTLEGGAKINGANITTTDVEATNGVIHVIDAIILPPSKDIVDTAVEAGNFTTLAQALTDAELIDALKGDGPYTVFAPTDAAFTAFEQANPGVLAGLSKEELTAVLLYHVVDGYYASGQLSDGMTVPTLNTEADPLAVSIDSGVKIDSSTVTTANLVTSNGIIHVIDAVLLP